MSVSPMRKKTAYVLCLVAVLALAITPVSAESRDKDASKDAMAPPASAETTRFSSEREAVMWRQQELKDIESLMRQLRFDLVNNRDAKAAAPRLQELEARARGDRLMPAFIAGTHGPGSDARPEIWEEWERFSTGFHDMEHHIATLIEAVNAEEYRIAAKALSDTGRSCKSCHRHYRYD